MPLVRLVYRSDSELTGASRAARELALAIAEHSRDRNAHDGITGALMFVNGVFVQVLEGEGPQVEATFERICRDTRHRRVVLLDLSEIDQRTFAGWGMVALEGDERARAMFPALSEATGFTLRNRLSANTSVELMVSILKRRAPRAREHALRATDIAI